MKTKHSFIAAICVGCLSSFAVAQEVELKTKYDGAKPSKETTTAKIEQTLTINNMDVNTGVNIASVKTYSPLPADSKGNIGVKVTTNSLKADYEFPGLSFTFDSTNANAPKNENPVADGIISLQRALSKAELTYRIDSKGNVVSAEGANTVLDEAPEQIRSIAQSQLKPETLRTAFAERNDFVPDKAVKVGDVWTKKSQTDLGLNQILTLTTEYKYLGEEKRGDRTLDKIEGKVTAVSLTQEPNPMATIEKSDLKPAESKISILFDRAKGQRAESSMMVRIEGGITIAVMGQQLDSQVKLRIENSVKIEE